MASKQVNISQLQISQLDQLKNQLEEDLRFLSTSMTQLKVVQQKLKQSKESVAELSDGKEILVPLTGSMYVPGTLKNTDRLICSIGTGYYVEKTPKETEDYFQRRVQFVTTNLEKLQQTLVEKHKMREQILAVMQNKMQAHLAAMQGQKGQSLPTVK